MEAIRSSETSVLTRVTGRSIAGDALTPQILHPHSCFQCETPNFTLIWKHKVKLRFDHMHRQFAKCSVNKQARPILLYGGPFLWRTSRCCR
jgi:hypothetical protein